MFVDRISRENSPRRPAASVRALALLTMALAAGCSGSSTPTSPTPPPAAPSLTCPAEVTATSVAGSGVAVTYTTPTATGGVPPLNVTCSPPSGATFPVGTTSVVCTATSGNNTTASCAFNVVVAPPSARVSRTQFLAFGDSFTAGEVTSPVQASSPSLIQPTILVPQASYPTQLELLLRGRYQSQSASIMVSNAGKPGERAPDGANRFPSVLGTSRPEVLLLLDGANDLSFGQSAITSAAGAVEAMAGEARRRGARVFIANMPPSRTSGTRALSASVVQEYNSRIASVARSEGAVLVDLYNALLPSVDTYIGVDGLHPTEAGYRRMAETFFEAIRRELELP